MAGTTTLRGGYRNAIPSEWLREVQCAHAKTASEGKELSQSWSLGLPTALIHFMPLLTSYRKITSPIPFLNGFPEVSGEQGKDRGQSDWLGEIWGRSSYVNDGCHGWRVMQSLKFTHINKLT